tara:strand:- start:668 stop:823 length:156 start_codon:yes stop_codon:yes gene_type:complete
MLLNKNELKDIKENIDKGLTLQLPLTISDQQYDAIYNQIQNYLKTFNNKGV